MEQCRSERGQHCTPSQQALLNFSKTSASRRTSVSRQTSWFCHTLEQPISLKTCWYSCAPISIPHVRLIFHYSPKGGEGSSKFAKRSRKLKGNWSFLSVYGGIGLENSKKILEFHKVACFDRLTKIV